MSLEVLSVADGMKWRFKLCGLWLTQDTASLLSSLGGVVMSPTTQESISVSALPVPSSLSQWGFFWFVFFNGVSVKCLK